MRINAKHVSRQAYQYHPIGKRGFESTRRQLKEFTSAEETGKEQHHNPCGVGDYLLYVIQYRGRLIGLGTCVIHC